MTGESEQDTRVLHLILIRHAKAQSGHSDQEDWDRALDSRGAMDAPEMGRRLKGRGLKVGKLVTSPAVRAVSTARLIARELGLTAAQVREDERLYLASAKMMLSVVQELGGTTSCLAIVGHNPGITEFADQLSGDRSIDNMPTCAIYSLQFAATNWSEITWANGMNAEFDYPRRT